MPHLPEWFKDNTGSSGYSNPDKTILVHYAPGTNELDHTKNTSGLFPGKCKGGRDAYQRALARLFNEGKIKRSEPEPGQERFFQEMPEQLIDKDGYVLFKDAVLYSGFSPTTIYRWASEEVCHAVGARKKHGKIVDVLWCDVEFLALMTGPERRSYFERRRARTLGESNNWFGR